MRYYPAVVEKEADSDYGVFFPDFPGCIGAGATLDEAVRDAEAALKLHVEGTLAEGGELPEPSEIEALAVDRDIERVAFVMVPLKGAAKAVRVNVTFDEALLVEIDTSAKAMGLTRSGFLAEAARDKMEAT